MLHTHKNILNLFTLLVNETVFTMHLENVCPLILTADEVKWTAQRLHIFWGLIWAQHTYVSTVGDIRCTQFQISNSAGLKWNVLFSTSRRKPDTSGTQASVITPQATLSSWEFLSNELFYNGTWQRRNMALQCSLCQCVWGVSKQHKLPVKSDTEMWKNVLFILPFNTFPLKYYV